MVMFVTKDSGARRMPFSRERLIGKINGYIKEQEMGIDSDTLDKYMEASLGQIETLKEISVKEIESILIKNALDYLMDFKDADDTMDFDKLGNLDFQYLASRILLNSLYKRASKNRSYDPDKKYGDFFGLLSSLGERGLVDPLILRDYTKQEIETFGSAIQPDRDYLFTYAGLYNLTERYLIRAKDETRSIYELPQERYMLMAMAVHRKEVNKEARMRRVIELYDEVSKHNITMATPTFTNAGRPDGQFSSCFILTTEDSLRSIYDDNTDAATLSKAGGGIGTYLGKVRAAGSAIKGNKGVGGGVIGWLKQLDNTAVSVDQLGVRKGAIAAYLDVWHRDIENFLELRLNTGDLSMRAHNLFLGVTIPDLFMEKVKNREDWYLFDPHEVRTVMGYSLEDYYDENKGDGSFRKKYYECVDSPELKLKRRVPAIEIMKMIMKSQLETGLPYMFYRDSVNRDNPNKHEGIIYSSNLC